MGKNESEAREAKRSKAVNARVANSFGVDRRELDKQRKADEKAYSQGRDRRRVR